MHHLEDSLRTWRQEATEGEAADKDVAIVAVGIKVTAQEGRTPTTTSVIIGWFVKSAAKLAMSP